MWKAGQAAKLLFASQHVGDGISHILALGLHITGDVFKPLARALVLVAHDAGRGLIPGVEAFVHMRQQR